MKTNKHRTICAILCAALISASTFACLPLTAAIDTDITVSAANTSQPPKLNLTQLSLGKGESYKLSADQSVSWRTSAPKILTVDKNGNVKAVGIGTAWITAKNSAGKESSCKITVKKATDLNGNDVMDKLRSKTLFYYYTVTGNESSNPSADKSSKGDPNSDGKINAIDASDVLNVYAKLATNKTQPTKDELACCDVNNDGKVNAVDASYVLSYYAYTQTGGTDSFADYMKNH